MDTELVKGLKEIFLHSFQDLNSAERIPNIEQCGCLNILKDLFRKIDERLQTMLSPKTDTLDQNGKMLTNSVKNVSQKRRRATNESVDEFDEPLVKRAMSPTFQPVVTLQRTDSIEPNQLISNTRYTNANAMRMRMSVLRKTIAVDRPIDGNDSENDVEDTQQTVATWTNTNRQMYFSNGLYRTLCMLCNKKEHFLVPHYVKQHPEHEVIIARLSPDIVNNLRMGGEPFEMCQSKIAGLCLFCEEKKSMYKQAWAMHILTHTGEQLYICPKCNQSFKQKTGHNKCNGQINTIFATNASDATLNGFLCKGCNYLQVNQGRLIEHLKTQHKFSALEVSEYCEKVVLVPDLSTVKSNIRFGYVEDSTRFKCTICAFPAKSIDDFARHFGEIHTQVGAYTCFCKEILTLDECSPHTNVSQHLQLHSADLYQCMVCDTKLKGIYFTEVHILDHISMNHSDGQLKFQHLHRELNSLDTVTEMTISKFNCSICKKEYKYIDDAKQHFDESHPDQMIDFKVYVSKKCSQMTNKVNRIETTVSCDRNGYTLRQCFLCTRCNYQSSSKEKLLAHHNDEHELNVLNVNIGNPTLVHNDSNDIFRFDHSFVYSCYWCYQMDEEKKFIGGNVESIHKHWLTNHTDPTVQFKFYVEPFGKCNYCEMAGTYKGLLEHSGQHTSPACFVDINNTKKCLICDFTGNKQELSSHFESDHDLILNVNMFNPSHLKAETIDQLLAIDTYKKHRCLHCEEDFETQKEYEEHHLLKHKQMELKSTEFVDNDCKELLVSCCLAHVHPSGFINHLYRHDFQFSCKNCEINFTSLHEAAQHDEIKHNQDNALNYRWTSLDRTLRKVFYRTKVCFGNGLVLYKQNLIGSTFDDSERFEQFVQFKKAKHYEQLD